jgi:putative two-component system response regulator
MTTAVTDIFREDLLDVIHRMAHIAEYRKANTLSHLDRIREYCLILATGLEFSTQEARIISYASQLHDIGEVDLPEQLLTRNGKLTPYEWEMIKRHPVVGAEILKGSSSPILQVGARIALTHHERWDGSGYPQGLIGEEIPIAGRICAVADVFDALTTRRPYKDELPVEQALQLIRESSGQFFDPQVVEQLSQQFDEILEVRRMNL